MTDMTRQEKLAALEKQQTKEGNLKKGIWATAIVAVVALGGFFAFTSVQNDPPPASTQLTPKLATEDGAWRFAKGSAADNKDVNADSGTKRVQMWFDPICPGCGATDRALADTIKSQVNNGEITLFLSPLAFLDSTSSDRYSSRAVSAWVTVAENSPEKAIDFMKEIYKEENQPQEGSAYRSVKDEDLRQWALTVGVPTETADKILNRSYTDWALRQNDSWSARKEIFPNGLGTPTIFMGGKYSGPQLEGGRKANLSIATDILSSYQQELASTKVAE